MLRIFVLSGPFLVVGKRHKLLGVSANSRIGFGQPECGNSETCLFTSANGYYYEGCGQTSIKYNWVTGTTMFWLIEQDLL
jgi:hypothetical protein